MPAVKDSGVAQRLLAKLNLYAILQIEDELVAYIRGDDKSEKAVRKGDPISKFIVEDIGLDRVTLSLDGVFLELRM